VHDGRGRNPIQVEQLVRAQPKQIEHLGIERGDLAVTGPGNHVIRAGAPRSVPRMISPASARSRSSARPRRCDFNRGGKIGIADRPPREASDKQPVEQVKS